MVDTGVFTPVHQPLFERAEPYVRDEVLLESAIAAKGGAMTPADAGPLGSPVTLTALIDYQEGSIVSRTLVKQPAGTVTLFAFGRGEGLSEHTSPHDALAHLLDGAAEVVVGDTTYRVRGGEALLLPAGIPHALRAVEPFKLLLTMIRARTG